MITDKKMINERQDKRKNIKQNILIISASIIAGLVNGFFGGGGGMILVPFLNYYLKYSSEISHATAMLVILPISVCSGLFYASRGLYSISGIPVTIGVIIGGMTGAFLLPKISSAWLTIIFSAVMIIAGVKMILL